jgi:plasmid stabilization system protein ParE
MAAIILPGAQDDLFELRRYMLSRWNAAAWDKAEEEIFDRFSAVDAKPNLGKMVPELIELGVMNYFQTLTSHHKIVYEPVNRKTYIHIVANFSQDFQTVLKRRVLTR